jgi:hypothetical protein
MIPDNAKVRVRMYRQGLGDCFLLTFFKSGKAQEDVHILIDCGTLGHAKQEEPADPAEAARQKAEKVEMIDVIQNIAAETGKHLHLLVITHEHKDHVSGFNKTGQAVFDQAFQVDHVWLAWTEDREDELAQSLAEHKKDLLEKTLNVVETLSNLEAPTQEDKNALLGIASPVRKMLNFSGDLLEEGNLLAADDFRETVDAAMDYASTRAASGPTFLWPRSTQRGKPEKGPVLEPDFLPGWRFYVLGPPYNRERLNQLGDHTSKELFHLSERLTDDLAANLGFLESGKLAAAYRDSKPLREDLDARQKFDAGFPFDACFRVEKGTQENRRAYKRLAERYEEEDWRRIDYDWLFSLGDLALQLDNSTNNASLVLAIEEPRQNEEEERVLLFPGDAQLGNWVTWDGSLKEGPLEFIVKKTDPATGKKAPVKVTSKDLLERTVFYKVGHHASHNATTEAGLQAMNEKAAQMLVAMIPVDSERAKRFGWTMPAPKLYKELLGRTNGHVLRSDRGWPSEKDWPDVKKMRLPVEVGNVVYADRDGKFQIQYEQKQDGSLTGLYIDYFMC